GDDAFRRFLRGYYARWALRHVDEAAMRAEAERAAGRDLGWFFDQWVHRTGLVDYALRSTKIAAAPGGGGWVTRVRVDRVGSYAHPMPVGARTEQQGWTIVRTDPLARTQTVEIRTAERPLEVQLDPSHTTEDWYGPNDFGDHFPDVKPAGLGPKYVVDWPFLEQSQSDRYLAALAPLATASAANGVLFGLRARGNYQGLVDRDEVGVLFASREPRLSRELVDPTRDNPLIRLAPASGRVQWWAKVSDPRPFGRDRPILGLSIGVWSLDGIMKGELRKQWDASRFLYAPGVRQTWALALTTTQPYASVIADPFRWSGQNVAELSAALTRRGAPRPAGGAVNGIDASLALGAVRRDRVLGGESGQPGYVRAELAGTRTWRSPAGRDASFLRAYAAYAGRAPAERQIYASAADPTTTFANHLWRPLGGPLAPSVRRYGSYCCVGQSYHTLADGHYRPLGGAALRGYDPLLALGSVVAVNAEQARRLPTPRVRARGPSPYASVFVDAGVPLESDFVSAGRVLADAGVGLSLRGMLFDRDVRVRADFPLFVRAAGPDVVSRSVGAAAGESEARFRFAFSFNDLW
ncbi:MAG TPA: hypothetical protein VFJ74_13705, partial [Gemmatimonadaceae bacterium]|nr:hypothetical protein [Gemmatimonadaceae bacterium]